MLSTLITAPRQRGIALVVGLVMLTVLTLLVVTAIKIGILELKIGGVSYGAAQNFANIDLALSRFMNDNSGNFQADCLGLDRGKTQSCFYPAATKPSDVHVKNNGSGYTATYDLYAGKVDVQAQEVSCVTNAARGTGNNLTTSVGHAAPDLFTADMTATAQGNFFGLTVVRQGAQRLLAPCACGTC